MTSTKAELEALLERVEKADWPKDMVLYSPWLKAAAELMGLDDDDKHGLHVALCGSIDASVALAEKMLPGWAWMIESAETRPDDKVLRPRACVFRPWPNELDYETAGATPALALCAALLRALIARAV